MRNCARIDFASAHLLKTDPSLKIYIYFFHNGASVRVCEFSFGNLIFMRDRIRRVFLSVSCGFFYSTTSPKAIYRILQSKIYRTDRYIASLKEIYHCRKYAPQSRRYIFSADCFVWCSSTDKTSNVMALLPKETLTTSPTFTSLDGFATLPLISILPPSQASAATVRLLITLDTFKNLSIRIGLV